MGKEYIEKRIVKAGIRLSERRIELKGTPILAEDIRKMEVRTLAPALEVSYSLIGAVLMVLAIWFHFEIRNMAMSIVVLLIGFGNIAFVLHGKPKRVSEFEDEIDLMNLTAEIVDGFVKKMDKS
ncbi:hypothetical protein MLD52_20600 [Puniceicoccaceae bacterium K14]|nr:hypothetical protein [Puniceicoccaceae bacterium K14]